MYWFTRPLLIVRPIASPPVSVCFTHLSYCLAVVLRELSFLSFGSPHLLPLSLTAASSAVPPLSPVDTSSSLSTSGSSPSLPPSSTSSEGLGVCLLPPSLQDQAWGVQAQEAFLLFCLALGEWCLLWPMCVSLSHSTPCMWPSPFRHTSTNPLHTYLPFYPNLGCVHILKTSVFLEPCVILTPFKCYRWWYNNVMKS